LRDRPAAGGRAGVHAIDRWLRIGDGQLLPEYFFKDVPGPIVIGDRPGGAADAQRPMKEVPDLEPDAKRS
jgi:hypothetical protein